MLDTMHCCCCCTSSGGQWGIFVGDALSVIMKY